MLPLAPVLALPEPQLGSGDACLQARVNSTGFYSREMQLLWPYVGRPSAESRVKAVLLARPISASRDKSPSTGVLVTAAPVARS